MKKVNMNAISAVWKRQLGSLMGNPLGYVFILAYVVVAGGFLFIPDPYFSRNIADLGPLMQIMPWLLVILLPAIAMGSWASERELGTDEQLLTLPLSEADAVIGKWLAVASFFTLALMCSLANVAVIAWLGNPDLGLTAANYAGWWIAGLVFAALSVLASTLVSLPAVAFVLGALFCAAAMAVGFEANWFDPFNRGLFPPANAAMGVTAVFLFIGIAVTAVSSRRWHRAQRGAAYAGIVSLVGVVIILFNLSVQVDRTGVELDVTSEHLSSLSDTSVEVLKNLEQPVTIVAFISKQLPPELVVKGKEVENILKVIDRKMGSKVKLELFRPSDALDEAGALASTHYGLKPKKVVVDTVTGKEEQEIFLGASIMCGANTQKIDHFEPGLSVEYELVRAIRTVATPRKKVVGVAQTDVEIMGGFDYQTRQMRMDWEAVSEWRKQYELRAVNLDVEVGGDVDVLVVPQPSSLTESQIEVLHDYIWAGRPVLLLEDTLPLFIGPELASSQPRKQSNPSMGGGQMQKEPKGNIQSIYKALGISMDLSSIAWSDYNPSHDFRQIWPKSLVWSMKQKNSIADSPVMMGISSLLMPFPGTMKIDPAKDDAVKITPLVSIIADSPWGHNSYNEHFTNSFFGMQKTEPTRMIPESGFEPLMAVLIEGKMRRAFSLPEDQRGQYGETAASGEQTAEADKAAEKVEDPKAQPDGTGKLSEKDIHVIMVSDIDFAHDEFFRLYRNENNMLSEDNLRFIRDIRNVQFLSNTVDALAGDTGFLELRTRRPQPRTFQKLEKVLAKTQTNLREAEESAQGEAEVKIAKLQADFSGKLEKIGQSQELDENAKAQLRAQMEKSAQRQLDADTEEINYQKNMAMRAARIEQQRAVTAVRNKVRWLAMGLPSLALALLAFIMFFNRRRQERLVIPTSRQRSAA